jgi:drug/metabolite transporter (DMT)-like permease
MNPAEAIPEARVEHRGRAILWMLATMGCFITLDTFMKLGLERYSLVQVTWGRFFFATLFTAFYCGRSLPKLMRSKVPLQQTGRSFFLMITTALFNAGIMFVPLVTATTIMFLTPIITTVLSVLVLQEYVGIRRWAGVAVGFLGAVIVVQPWTAGTTSFNIGTLFLLAASVSNASYQIATRTVREDHPLTSLLFTATFGAVIASLILPWHWEWPDLTGWGLLAASGLAGAIGHFCIIEAFRNAPASVVSPFSYSSLLWAALLGFLVWGDIPQLQVLAGAALIIASGLYIFFRERKLSTAKAE